MAMQSYLPLAEIVACDIDAELPLVAEKYFGFSPGARCHVRIQDGLDLISDLHNMQQQMEAKSTALPPTPSASASAGVAGTSTSPPLPPLPAAFTSTPSPDGGAVDLLFIDADSKDHSLGMSAPPPAFVADATLRAIHASLSPGGVVVFNVVARVSHEVFRLADRLRTVFCRVDDQGSVGMIKSSKDTVNIIVIAVKSVPGTTTGSRDLCPDAQRREALVEDWLHAVGVKNGQDPLTLLQLHAQYMTL